MSDEMTVKRAREKLTELASSLTFRDQTIPIEKFAQYEKEFGLAEGFLLYNEKLKATGVREIFHQLMAHVEGGSRLSRKCYDALAKLDALMGEE